MVTEDGTGRPVETIEKLLEIVEALVELEGAGVTELATHLEMSKSSVYNYLSTMVANDYAVKEGDRYRAGLRFFTVGAQLRDQQPGARLAEPIVENLAAETDERAQFIVEENGQGVFLHRATGDRAVDAGTRVGKRIWLHATGAGKVLLANMDEDRRDEVIAERGLPRRTPNTITDRDELERELADIRERGYSLNDEEGTVGLRSVGAPVSGPHGEVVGALSVSGPSQRLTDRRFDSGLIEAVLGSANELELRLSYP